MVIIWTGPEKNVSFELQHQIKVVFYCYYISFQDMQFFWVIISYLKFLKESILVNLFAISCIKIFYFIIY